MSFATEAAKSVNDARILIEIDIALINDQWVNNGAGIWAYNPNTEYSWVDASLFDALWTSADRVSIGSVRSDGVSLSEVADSSSLTPQEFSIDGATLYVCLQEYDEPSLHSLKVGFAYSFSHDEFTPSGMAASQPYEGRFQGSPSITLARDPLFFGRIAFGGGSVSIVNQDGEYDTLAQDNNLFGNEVRIYIGYESLDYDDYERVFTGYVDSASVGEQSLDITVSDRRKQLTRAITITATAENPVTTIKNILTTYFSASYDTDYFDTTVWATATADVAADGLTVSLNMQEPEPAIDVIENLCVAAAGIFYINADGKYSFRQIDPDASAAFTVVKNDVLTPKTINYNPVDVISSIRVGYGRDWVTSASTFTVAYTYYTDDSHETSVYNAYQTYNEQLYETYLDTLTSATNWATLVYPWHTDVHGETDINIPLKYYDDAVITGVGTIEIARPQATMLGTVTSEIKSISWNLGRVPTITLGVRFT